MSIWVLAADSARARVLKTETNDSEFTELTAMYNPEGRLKENSLVSDSPGSQSDGGGMGRHAVPPRHSHKRTAAQRFAKEVAHTLETAYENHDYHKLYIVAAPQFLGELRSHLPNKIRQTVVGEYDRNVTTFSAEEIRHVLPRYL